MEREKNLKTQVLVNRKTNRVASISSWLSILKARAFLKRDFRGIAGILAVGGAEILRCNKLSDKRKSYREFPHANETIRLQANALIPILATMWGQQLAAHREPRRLEFAKWIHTELTNGHSRAYAFACAQNFHDLLAAKRSARWWLDQLKKLQSKNHT